VPLCFELLISELYTLLILLELEHLLGVDPLDVDHACVDHSTSRRWYGTRIR